MRSAHDAAASSSPSQVTLVTITATMIPRLARIPRQARVPLIVAHVFTKNVSIKVRYPDIFEVDIFEVFLGNVVFINTKTNRRQRQTFRLTHECFFSAANAEKDRDLYTFCDLGYQTNMRIDDRMMST